MSKFLCYKKAAYATVVFTMSCQNLLHTLVFLHFRNNLSATDNFISENLDCWCDYSKPYKVFHQSFLLNLSITKDQDILYLHNRTISGCRSE